MACAQHCHHHGPVGKDPFPAEGATGCASQKSQKCPKTCDVCVQPALAVTTHALAIDFSQNIRTTPGAADY
jgi:hypothetical protein